MHGLQISCRCKQNPPWGSAPPRTTILLPTSHKRETQANQMGQHQKHGHMLMHVKLKRHNEFPHASQAISHHLHANITSQEDLAIVPSLFGCKPITTNKKCEDIAYGLFNCSERYQTTKQKKRNRRSFRARDTRRVTPEGGVRWILGRLFIFQSEDRQTFPNEISWQTLARVHRGAVRNCAGRAVN